MIRIFDGDSGASGSQVGNREDFKLLVAEVKVLFYPGSVTAFAAKGSYCFFMDLYFKNPFLIPTWFFLLVKFESIFEKTGH